MGQFQVWAAKDIGKEKNKYSHQAQLAGDFMGHFMVLLTEPHFLLFPQR